MSITIIVLTGIRVLIEEPRPAYLKLYMPRSPVHPILREGSLLKGTFAVASSCGKTPCILKGPEPWKVWVALKEPNSSYHILCMVNNTVSGF